MSDTLQMLLEQKIVAIVRGVSSEHIIPAVQALKDGGVCCVEVTFDAKSHEASEDTLKSISMIRNYFGTSIALGAGTVITPEDVYRAKEAGATYIISPNTDREVIQATKRLDLLSIPGAMTPTEIINAHKWGADIVKLFPAASLGMPYIKALLGPITHIPVMAVGGVDAKNAQDFIDIGCVGVGVGGNLVNKKLIESGNFAQITTLAKEYHII